MSVAEINNNYLPPQNLCILLFKQYEGFCGDKQIYGDSAKSFFLKRDVYKQKKKTFFFYHCKSRSWNFESCQDCKLL